MRGCQFNHNFWEVKNCVDLYEFHLVSKLIDEYTSCLFYLLKLLENTTQFFNCILAHLKSRFFYAVVIRSRVYCIQNFIYPSWETGEVLQETLYILKHLTLRAAHISVLLFSYDELHITNGVCCVVLHVALPKHQRVQREEVRVT